MSGRKKLPYTDDELLAIMRRGRRYENLDEILKPARCKAVCTFLTEARWYFEKVARGIEDPWQRHLLEESGRAADRALKGMGLGVEAAVVLASEQTLDQYIERVKRGLPDPPPKDPYPWEIDDSDLA